MMILRDLWGYLKVRKKYWLAPIFLVLILIGLIFAFAALFPVVSPLIYAL